MNSNYYKFSDIVFPIVKIKIDSNNKAKYLHFLGSGFFIGNEGYFLTANHVLNEDLISDLKNDEKIAIQIYNGNFQLLKVDYVENNDDKLDVSLCQVNFVPKNKNFFSINKESEVYGWHDVHAQGYPGYLVEDIPKKGQLLKGYISREINKGEIVGSINNAPPSYALNFPIPKGMSGCPLFKTGASHPLVGICIGSFESTTTLWENTFYEDDFNKITENSKRVIENGLAIKIFDIKGWNIKKTKTTLHELF